MGASRGKSSERGTDRRFVPLLVLSADASVREHVAGELRRELDLAVETSSGDCPSARRLARTGVLVPAFDDTSRCGSLIEALRKTLDARDRSIPIVAASRSWAAEGAIEAFRAGADDVIDLSRTWPGATRDRLVAWVERRAVRDAASLFGTDGPRFIGSSQEILESVRMVKRIAPSDATALILGESGTGKELIARAIHAFSRRAAGPFIAINCAAIPDTLLENELFGHERGAYTGASSTAIGKVEAAEHGSLFLDEIGEMPIQLQSKILRLLQEKTYDRIGGTRAKSADIRIIAATNAELKREIAAGRFREDLYYRLSVVPLVLPSLRDRAEDIPLLARDILERLAKKLGRPGLSLTDAALNRLLVHRWPGNVRELENELERAAVLARSDLLDASDIELNVRVVDSDAALLRKWIHGAATLSAARQAGAEQAGRLAVSDAMQATAGDVPAAAARLGIEPEQLADVLAEMSGETAV